MTLRLFRAAALASHRWRIRCVWLVVFALLWGWFAAPLVQVLDTSGNGWVQVCTSFGAKFVHLGQDDGASASRNSKSAPLASTSTDCPYCRAHASFGLAPADVQIPVLFEPAYVPPLPPAPRAASLASPWPPVLPRAPPSTISA